MSACRICHCTVKFVVMEDSGKTVVVEPIPDRTGTIAVRVIKAKRYGMSPSFKGYALAADRPLQPGYTLYRTHYAECRRIAPNHPDQPPPQPAPRPSLFDL